MLQNYRNVDWKCAGASVIGNSHESNGTECQDAWSKHTDQGVLAACVCDGAGSAKFSQFGAQKTAAIVSEWLAAFFEEALAQPQETIAVILDEVQMELQKLSQELACQLRELACTLVAAAVDDKGRWGYWHLGDGGIIAQFEDKLQVLSAPQKGEFANETYFVTDRDSLEHLRWGVFDENSARIIGLAVFSDGVEMLLYNHSTMEVASAVPNMLRWLSLEDEETIGEAIATNLTEVFRQKTNDDCTLVLLSKNIP